ncbi:stress response kinase A [Desulforhopalus sp. 52FAK]
MDEMIDTPDNDFQQLTPDRVLTLIEQRMGVRCNNLFRPMNSYINRVFEVETTDQTRLIAKFYRPNRWTKEAILDEHQFLLDLKEQEIPVIAPLTAEDGSTLGTIGDLHFTVFPKCGGRSVDEFTDDQWLQLGRLIGRMHQVGETAVAKHRVTMGPEYSSAQQLQYLLASRCVPEDLKRSLEQAVTSILGDINPLFAKRKNIRIHGDCHFANFIHRPGESLYIIDFDDMVMGPPVQDIWMLLPGGLEDTFVELDLFLEGYETFRPFDQSSLRLVEPLRAMRFIHYMAWCAHQVEEDGETRAIDGFGSREYWQQEIADLLDQADRIAKMPTSFGGNC